MSKDIRVQWYRGGSTSQFLQSPDVIPMQLDNLGVQEAQYYNATQPYFSYSGYVNTNYYPFEYQDLLIDTTTIDPKTNALTRYRIVNDPEFFPDAHVQLVLNRVMGI